MACNAIAWSGRVTQLTALPSLAACRQRCSWVQAATARTLRVQGGRPAVSSRAAPAHASATGQEEAQSPQANGGPPQLDADEFSGMLETLREWKHQYYDCNVPRRVHDAPELGEWVHHMRGLRRRGQLPPAAEQQLEALGFSWDLDVVTAKWYHNLHAARQYREVHGSGDIPPDFADAAHPDWVEAARWLERQRDLYRRQKLLLVRVRLLKQLLGIKLDREYSKPKRHLHPVLKQGNAAFRADQRQRQKAEPQQGQGQAGGGGSW